jgi:hypothetical protein
MNAEINDELLVISNGTVVGETAHALPANMILAGVLAFQSNAAIQSLWDITSRDQDWLSGR